MEWVSVADKKPDKDTVCWVCNNKYYAFDIRVASYNKDYDVWVECDSKQWQCACLDVTHYIIQPPIPKAISCNSN